MRVGAIQKFDGAGFPSLSRELALVKVERKDVKGYYETLGVSPDATDKEIRSAARKRLKEVHPDGTTPDREAFEAIHEAYETLTSSRSDYDAMQEERKDDGPSLSEEEQELFDQFVEEEGQEVIDKLSALVDKQLSLWSFFSVGFPDRYVDLAQDWYEMAIPILADLGYKGSLTICVVPSLREIQFDQMILGVPVRPPSGREIFNIAYQKM